MSIAGFSDWLHGVLAVFARPRTRRIVLILAVLLVMPSLLTGLSLDDYILLYYRRPDAIRGLHRGPFDMFLFSAHRWLIDGFGLPWWTLENATGHFMRPVSSLTHALDAWLWPEQPVWMHLHSIAWFAAGLVLAGRLYSLIEAPWAAGVAFAAFALEDAHGLPVGWISNRNALIGAVFGFGALIAHHRFRREGKLRLAVAGWLCFALALLSAELSIATAAYLFAHALFVDTGSTRQRLSALLPYALILAAWSAAYVALGYGTHGLGSYLDPLRGTAVFVRALPQRWAMLMASQLGIVPSDFWVFISLERRSWFIGSAVLVVAFVSWFVWPTLRARRTSRFWACGAALSAVPGAATMPNDRLLVFVGLGGLALMANAVHDTLDRLRGCAVEALRERRVAASPEGLLRAGSAALFSGIHLVIAGLCLPIRSMESWIPAQFTEQADSSIPNTRAIERRTLVIAHVSTSLVISYLPAMRLFRREPLPERLYWLAATPSRVRVERTGPNVLRVRPEGGFYPGELEQHYRSVEDPFKVGDRVVLSEFTVHVVALTPDARPAVCDFVFARPLEAPEYLWMTWKPGGFVPFKVPAIGEATWSSVDPRAPR
jgi:hypothetical protein